MRISSFLVAVALCAFTTGAQQRVAASREDGRTTPLLVYAASPQPQDCAPLAVLSHGAGGSENGLAYLARAMSQLGYTAVVMGHRESGRDVVVASAEAKGRRASIQGVVADPAAAGARLMDVSAALAWTDKQCHAPYRVLLGHSMGAETVMLEAGAHTVLALAKGQAGRDRFNAYVALSPLGPGTVFPDDAWKDLHKPMLVLTGTLDGALNGGAQIRQAAWKDMPGMPSHCQWLGVVDGGTHMNFGGNGPGAERVDSFVTATVPVFLRGAKQAHCVLPPVQAGFTLQAK